ncbi:CBS domain-containing protein [Streptomyces sp. NPDC091209]|uniref:CBS domain-containing protein n=1 Tax=Streptomyces sp. NPDC091209 TaxID=3365974 RepID=UPI00381216B0
MALVQTQPRSAGPAWVVKVTPAAPAVTPAVSTVVVDPGDASGPRVRGDMTVEVALSVMAGARVGYLLVCDEDDQCTGSVTEAQLALVRDGSAYTDRVRVRDVLVPRRTPAPLVPSP